MLYRNHIAVWVTKGLINNMVSFFFTKTLKLGGQIVSPFYPIRVSSIVLSSKQNTTLDFRLGVCQIITSRASPRPMPTTFGGPLLNYLAQRQKDRQTQLHHGGVITEL